VNVVTLRVGCAHVIRDLSTSCWGGLRLSNGELIISIVLDVRLLNNDSSSVFCFDVCCCRVESEVCSEVDDTR
jgi:hypothetical protein